MSVNRALALIALLALPGCIGGQVFREAEDAGWILVHRVDNPSQARETAVKVLPPADVSGDAY